MEEVDEATGAVVRHKKSNNIKRRKRRGGNRFIDDEVEVSTDEEVSSDEELDDDLIDDVAEDDDMLLIDDDEVDEADDEETARRKERSRAIKRRRRRRKGTRTKRKETPLDEEDYNLIAENLGVQVRPSIDDDVLRDEDEGEEGGEESGAQKNKRRRLKKDTSVRTEDLFMPVMEENKEEERTQRRARRLMDEEEKDRAFIDNSGDGGTAAKRRRGHIDEGEHGDDELLNVIDQEPVRGGRSEAEDDERGDDTAMDDEEWGGRDRGGRAGKLESLFGNVKAFLSESSLLGKRSNEAMEGEEDEEEAAVIGRRAEKRKREVELKKAAEAAEPAQLIRDLDLPERMQLRVQRQGTFATASVEVQKEEMKEEAMWMLPRLREGAADVTSQEAMLGWVEAVLSLLRVQHMEVPYIVTYCKDVFSDDSGHALSEDAVWLIDQLDAEWDLLQSRRRRLLHLAAKYAEDDHQLRAMIKGSLHSEDLDDVQDHLKILSIVRHTRRIGAAAVAGDEGEDSGKRRSTTANVRRAEYSLTRDAVASGVDTASGRLGLSAHQFAENLKLRYHLHMPADPPYDLEESATAFLGRAYGTVSAVIDGMVSFTALRLASDPTIRREVKLLVWSSCVVSTRPTTKGKREVDDTHEYVHILQVDRKPVPAFADNPAQFLLMGKALKEGFIELSVEVEKEPGAAGEGPVDPIFRTLCELYISANHTDDAREWNVHRKAILTKAYASLLARSYVYVKGRLLRDGIERVIKASERRLYQHLTAGPFNPPPSSSAKDDRRDRWRIISGCVGDGSSPSFFAVLNSHGFVLDTLVLHFLKSRASARNRDGSQLNEGERLNYARKKEDVNKFAALVTKHRPALIALDASSLDVLSLKEEIEQKALVDSPETRVELFDPELARIFSNSARGEVELKEHDRHLRLAVGLGRRVLDPISELCATWSTPMHHAGGLLGSLGLIGREAEGLRRAAVQASANPLANDILAMHLHSLQGSVPVSQLLRALERSVLKVVNKVGVDINRLTTRPWLTGTMQFVSGLGPIKAQAILTQIKRRGFLPNRDSLLRKARKPGEASDALDDELGMLGPCVHANCAGFLKVHPNTEMESSPDVLSTMLDQTRIHPERYDLAAQIAREALNIDEDAEEEKEEREEEEEEEEEDDPDDDQERQQRREKRKQLRREQRERSRPFLRQARHVAELMTNRDRANSLETLDLPAFALIEYEERNVRILHTLQMIKAELINPFDTSNILRPFTTPTPAELFTTLTGETSRSLREGQLMTVQVQGFTARGCYVTLDGGLRGFLRTENVSSSAPTFDYKSAEERDRAIKWLKARLAMNQAVEVRVMRIDRQQWPYSVEVSTRSADLARHPLASVSDDSWLMASEEERLFLMDKYAVPLPSAEQRMADELHALRSSLKKRPFIQRAIIHPSFRNCTREEAVAALESMPPGEVVVRPSSVGTDRVVVTWKVSDDMYGHVEVREGAKGANPLELGASLSIGEQRFEDVDEILARFIAPMARLAHRLIAHKNFRLGDSAEIEAILRVEKDAYPRKIPYAVSFLADDKGSFRAFLFSFLPSDRVKSEKITVGPKGFGFGGKTYRDPEQVIGALKHTIKVGGTKQPEPPPTPLALPPARPPAPQRPPPPPAVHYTPPPPPPPPPASTAPARYAAPVTSGFVHPSRAIPIPGDGPPPPPPAAAYGGGYTGAGAAPSAGRASRWSAGPSQPLPAAPGGYVPGPPVPPSGLPAYPTLPYYGQAGAPQPPPPASPQYPYPLYTAR